MAKQKNIFIRIRPLTFILGLSLAIISFALGYIFHTNSYQTKQLPQSTVYQDYQASTLNPQDLSYSPDEKKSVYIDNTSIQNAQSLTNIVYLTVNSQKIELFKKVFYPQAPDWQETWEGFTIKNWSSDSRFVAMKVTNYKSGDVYVFRTDGKLFSNGKPYLLASQIGYSQDLVREISWQSPTQLRIIPETGVINYLYILDTEKETVQRGSAGD